MAGRHISIATWLDALNMAEHGHLFRGYGGVEDLIYFGENEIKDIGVLNNGNRAKIVSSLRILREKYEKGQVSGTGLFSLQRTPSMPGSTPGSPTSPDPDFLFVIGSPEKLQADLQKELSGDPSEIRSRSWYHGNISRQRAESLVTSNGDFLVRDCISKPGDFVLTCMWKDAPLHFMINSVIRGGAPGTLPMVTYQLEEEEFPSIKHLLSHYQRREKPVSVASEAILKNPISRCMPLSCYDSKYGAVHSFPSSAFSTPLQSPVSSPFVTPFESPWSSPEMQRRRIESNQEPIIKVSQTANGGNRKLYIPQPSLDKCDSLPIINVTPPTDQLEPMPLHYRNEESPSKPVIAHTRAGSAPANIPETSYNERDDDRSTADGTELDLYILHGELTNTPPPKPSRIPSDCYTCAPKLITPKILPCSNQDYYNDVHENIMSYQIHENEQLDPVFHDDRSTSSTRLSQQDIKSHCVYRDRTCAPSQSQPTNLNPTSSQPHKNLQDRNSRASLRPASHRDLRSENSPSRTYKIVARSRSLHLSRNSMDVNGNNHSRGYRTPNNRSARARTTERDTPTSPITNQRNNNNNNKNNNYNDYVNETSSSYSDIFHLQDLEYKTPQHMIKSPKFCVSFITPDSFKSSFLPKHYKALDASVLNNIKTTLLNKSPHAVALNITKYDLTLMSIAQERDFGLGVTSGLELLTLPQGKQLRQDIIERWDSLRLFVLVILLTAQSTKECAKILSFLIQISLQLKTNAGNLYSFAAMMAALTGQQISQRTEIWSILREMYTGSAYVFDTNLRPAFISLTDASCNISLSDICVPYVTPVCYILEQNVDSVLQGYYWERDMDPIASSIDVLLAHLDAARVIASQSKFCLAMGKSLEETMTSDPELGHILCPEFHLLVLWGDKGYKVSGKTRIDKLEEMLMNL